MLLCIPCSFNVQILTKFHLRILKLRQFQTGENRNSVSTTSISAHVRVRFRVCSVLWLKEEIIAKIKDFGREKMHSVRSIVGIVLLVLVTLWLVVLIFSFNGLFALACFLNFVSLDQIFGLKSETLSRQLKNFYFSLDNSYPSAVMQALVSEGKMLQHLWILKENTAATKVQNSSLFYKT